MDYTPYLDLRIREQHRLPGEAHENFLLTATDGKQYLLKVSAQPSGEAAGFQRELLSHLQRAKLPFATPHLIITCTVAVVGALRQLNLYTYLPGRVLAEVNPRSPTLIRSWGRSCGELSRALQSFDHPYAHRDYAWDPLQVWVNFRLSKYFTYKEKKLAEYFFGLLQAYDPATLRRSVNYNDAHEHNLLVDRTDRIGGVIDFDDAVCTATACELAIAAAYAGMDTADPLGTWRLLTAAYHEVYPLEEPEVDTLFALIVARLLLTVTAAAEARQQQPHNNYLTVSESSAWALLRTLRPLDPTLVTAHFRVAVGLPATPQQATYLAWARTATPHPVLDLSQTTLSPLDLGVGSTVLGTNEHFEDPQHFTTHLRRYLTDANLDVAVGGYGEVRPVYTTDDFRGLGNDGPRWRSVHLGLDFWTRRAGATIYCPLDATVHHWAADPTAGGYGHCLILRHTPTPDLSFYTLYGHLAEHPLRDLRAGTQVKSGEPLAQIGSPEENGGWPPHLHFQLLHDPLNYAVDFPGVCYPEERAIWLGLCPDPRTLWPHPLPVEPTHPQRETILYRRRHHLGRSLSVSYREPLHILRGAGAYLYDATGRRYLDTVNNVAHVGHQHPRVVRALQQQAAVLNTNSRYLHPTLVELAERLQATLPDSLSVVHLVNSGSEANELALRMAATATGTSDTLAMGMGYHGNTHRTIAVSAYKFGRRGGGGQPAGTHLLPLPDTLRQQHLDPRPHLPDRRLNFIHESVLSCGGQLPLPPNFLHTVYPHVRERGGVCIADEVQTGLGRVGTHYWAFEQQGVVPDIVTIGKPFGNGHPLGAVVCTPAVADAFANGMEYFNTFGGNPVSATVGLTVLDVVRDEQLQAHALAMGEYLTERLRHLAQRYPLIADVRGSGLFLGVEMCSENFSPAAPPTTSYLVNRMRTLGFLMSTDGPHENVLKIKPPMCFSRNNADELLHYLEKVLGEDRAQPDY